MSNCNYHFAQHISSPKRTKSFPSKRGKFFVNWRIEKVLLL